MAQGVLGRVASGAIGYGALFLLSKMSQDAIDDVLVLNTGDDLYRSTTVIHTINSRLDPLRYIARAIYLFSSRQASAR